MKPIKINSRGAAVEDIQRRLLSLGYSLGSQGIDGIYLEDTAAAVRAFRADENLPEGDMVDDACWAALVDASFALGDRTLYLRVPFFHGNDVRELQTALAALGFACGNVDGILGAHTERALRDFQANAGIGSDGIAGSLTFSAIQRLHHIWEGKKGAPRSVVKIGFSRAATVLERMELCFFGIDSTTCQIASRISNLALATSPDSKVTSADSIAGIPPATMFLIGLTLEGEQGSKGIPFVVFSDEETLSSRIRTAVNTAEGKPPRATVSIPVQYFADASAPTVREQQHIAVTLLDAFCEAFV